MNLQKGFFVTANFRPSYRWFPGKNHYPDHTECYWPGMLPDAHRTHWSVLGQALLCLGVLACGVVAQHDVQAGVLAQHRDRAAAAVLWPAAATQPVRAGKRSEATALEAHERMTAIKVRLLGDRVSRRTAWKIARQHDWDTLRDAEYLAVTRPQADALVTVDPRLAVLAREAVAVAGIEDLLARG